MKRVFLGIKKGGKSNLGSLKKRGFFIGQEITVTEKGKSAKYTKEDVKGKKFTLKDSQILY